MTSFSKMNARLAVVRKLPAVREDFDDAAEDQVQRQLRPVQQLVHAIKTVQLLGALLQLAQDGRNLRLISTHSSVPVPCIAFPRLRSRVEDAFGRAYSPFLLFYCHPEEGFSPTKDLLFARSEFAAGKQQILRLRRAKSARLRSG